MKNQCIQPLFVMNFFHTLHVAPVIFPPTVLKFSSRQLLIYNFHTLGISTTSPL